MLADVTQVLDHAHRLGPIEVVDHDSTSRAIEVHKLLQLTPDALDPILDRGLVLHRPLSVFERRVADQSGSATNQHQRSMTSELQTPQE